MQRREAATSAGVTSRAPPTSPRPVPAGADRALSVSVSGVSIKFGWARRGAPLPGKWRLPLVARTRRRPRGWRWRRGPPREPSARSRARRSPRGMASLPRGFEPPRAPEDLGRRSLAELRELRRRQERLLRNEKFICKLPDKGKKIVDYAAKLDAAIAEHRDLRGNRGLSDPASLDAEQRLEAPVVDGDAGQTGNPDQILDVSSLVLGRPSAESVTAPKTAAPPAPRAGDEVRESETPASRSPDARSRAAEDAHGPQQCASRPADDASSSSDSLVIDHLQRITIADERPSEGNLTGLESVTPKKPHFMEVLEMRGQNPVPPLHKFKTNVLPSQHTASSSPCQGRESPVSSEERRRRDKQHLDDITAARLLPLHHMPAQLLSLEESLALQKQQKQSYEEMQAKLAAQKLAERLNIKMQSYNPEGDTSRKYREVRDEDDDQLSDDEA